MKWENGALHLTPSACDWRRLRFTVSVSIIIIHSVVVWEKKSGNRASVSKVSRS